MLRPLSFTLGNMGEMVIAGHGTAVYIRKVYTTQVLANMRIFAEITATRHQFTERY